MIPDFATIYSPRLSALNYLEEERYKFVVKVNKIWQSDFVGLNSICSLRDITSLANQDFSEDKKFFNEGILLYTAAKAQVQTDEEKKKIVFGIKACEYARDQVIKPCQEHSFSQTIEKNFLREEENVKETKEIFAADLKTLYKCSRFTESFGGSLGAYLNAIKSRRKAIKTVVAVFSNISELFKQEGNFKQAEMFSKLSKEYKDKEILQENQLDRYIIFCTFYGSVIDKRPNNFHTIFSGGFQKAVRKELAFHLKLFAEQNEHALTSDEKERLHKCRHQLLQLIEMQSTRPREIASKIASLAPGESLIMNVATTTPHAVLYKIERIDKDNYLFTIINTGYDEKNAHSRRPTENDVLVDAKLYAHKAWRIPQSALSVQACINLFGKKAAKKDLLSIISAIDEYFLRADIHGQRELGRLHHFQRHGSCFAKVMTSFVHEDLGQSLHERFKAYRTKQLIEKFQTWEKSLPLDCQEAPYREWTDPKKAIEERDALLNQTLSRQEAKAAKRRQTVS